MGCASSSHINTQATPTTKSNSAPHNGPNRHVRSCDDDANPTSHRTRNPLAVAPAVGFHPDIALDDAAHGTTDEGGADRTTPLAGEKKAAHRSISVRIGHGSGYPTLEPPGTDHVDRIRRLGAYAAVHGINADPAQFSSGAPDPDTLLESAARCRAWLDDARANPTPATPGTPWNDEPPCAVVANPF